MTTILGTYDHYGYAAIALLGTFVGAWFLLWVTLRSPWADELHTWRGVSPPFLGVVGVLFALTLAFLANDTWNAHDRALNAVYQEADGLRSIDALAEHLPAPIKARVVGAVRDYARITVTEEWPLLARRQNSRAASDQLDRLLSLLAGPDVSAVAPTGVHGLMLSQAVQVRAARGLRIALSQTHVNPLKWLGMAFLGFLTMISIAMVHVDQGRAEILAMVIFAAAAAPTAAIVLVQGNPFQQPTVVHAGPIAALAAEPGAQSSGAGGAR
ncbi:DUF4239 domain-containing protein [Paramagnetospirillum magneticum]|uniref:DUF4239 domain-containing protein n=1 Tax=Paramagnetospirillum magneticum (strain ATCC 700264 / AMB-1) TaxID=342108 RepID=Q2W9K0_PARM1|nr:DUF4239 domain-containing protein [Paramagnetospirillum magneticum]BAE49475.1 hypothetical protein amb0671 [Paramagnetospirillum magneticum AMB-1]